MAGALLRLVVFGCVTVCVASLTALRAQEAAKTYKVDPVHKQLIPPERPENPTREERTAFTKASAEVRANQTLLTRAKSELYTGNVQFPNPQYESRLDTLINNWELPLMTQYDDESLKKLPELRAKFIRDYLDRSPPPPVHERLVKTLLYPKLSKIVTGEDGEYHPAVRYNAMLIIGRLNEREAIQSAGKAELPIPYPTALTFMLDQFNNAEQIAAVRVAALLGVHRHAQLESQRPSDQRRIDGDTTKAIRATMLAVIKDKPANQSAGAQHWMQRRAVEILGLLGDFGAGGDVAKSLNDIAKDEKAPLSLRCTAAQAIAQLNYPAEVAKNINAVDFTRRFAEIAANACQQELDAIDQEIKRMQKLQAKAAGQDGGVQELPGAGAGAGGAEGGEFLPGAPLPGAGQADPRFPAELNPGEPVPSLLEPYKLMRSRRRMKATILTMQLAIGENETSGIRKYAKNDAEKKSIEGVALALTGLMKSTDTVPEVMTVEPTTALTGAVAEKVQELENELRPLTPADELEDDEPADAAPGIFPADDPAPAPDPEPAPATP